MRGRVKESVLWGRNHAHGAINGGFVNWFIGCVVAVID